MAKRLLRKGLSAPGLLRDVRACFEALDDPVQGRGLCLAECLMSGLAVFGLKYPSLLQFDRDARTDELVRGNLKRLYGIERAPCDTALRERLDEVDPRQLRAVFKRIFTLLQRGKGLEGFTCLDGHYLLSVDGTGYFSSSSVHCAQCCEKHHRDGRTTYYHQMLGAVLVHPDKREVFALAPEPIMKGDGAKKNDCERNAAKRLLSDVRREHPHLKLVVVEDALASNGPHIKHLKGLGMRFILGAKRADHEALFEWVEATQRLKHSAVKHVEHRDERGNHHRLRYLNAVPLNDTHFELEVNFLESWECRPDGRELHFAWVTDLPIDDTNAMELMRAARARWRHRERDVQHPEEPRRPLRAQLRARPQASGDGVRLPDDAGLPHRPSPAALLHAVRQGADQGPNAGATSGSGCGLCSWTSPWRGRRTRDSVRLSWWSMNNVVTALAGVRVCSGEELPGSRQKTSCDARGRNLRLPRVRPAIRNDRPR